MKYIKLYKYRKTRTTIINKFKVDDYVIAYKPDIQYNDKKENEFFKTRICQIDIIDNSNIKYSVVQVIYQRLNNSYFPNNSSEDELYWMFTEKELRLATPEEVEEYKIELNSNKYNL